MNDNQNPSAEPLVTPADLPVLKAMLQGGFTDGWRPVVERLIAAAEADKPALPEGWVLLDFPDGSQRVLWHSDGQFYVRSGNVHPLGEVGEFNRRERATPLVTAASLVPEGWHVDEDGSQDGSEWPTVLNANGVSVARRTVHPEGFDVLAALVSAAQAERGETR